SRQSQCPKKPPPYTNVASLLSQSPTPVAPPFSAARKLVNAVPSGVVSPTAMLQAYVLSTSCGSAASAPLPTAVVFFSHWGWGRLSLALGPKSTTRATHPLVSNVQPTPHRSVPIVAAPARVAHVSPFRFPASHCSPASIVPLPQTAVVGQAATPGSAV